MKKLILRALLVTFSMLLPGLAIFLVATEITPLEVSGILAESHPLRVAYEAYRKKYDDQNDVLALFVSPTSLVEGSLLFDQNNAARLAFGAVPGIERIDYLAWSDYFKEHTDGKFFFHSFFDQGRLTEEGYKVLTEQPLWKNQVLSPDLKAWLLPIKTLAHLNGNENYATVDALMTATKRLEQRFPGLKVHLLGTKVLKYHYIKGLNEIQGVAFGLVLIIIGGMCAWLFRSWISVLVFSYAIIMSFSVMAITIVLTERGIGPYASFSLFFVLMMASVTLVHLMNAMGEEGTVAERLAVARKKVLMPCLGTTVACVIGFFGLWTSSLQTIHNLGFYCIVGTVVAFFINMYLLPWSINLLNIPFAVKARFQPKKFVLLSKIIVKGRWYILIATAILAIFGIYYSSLVERNVDYYHQFPNNHPLTVAADEFRRNFGFETSIDVILTPKKGDYLAPSTEDGLKKLSEELQRIPNVSGIHSLYQYQETIRLLSNRMGKGTFEQSPLDAYLDLLSSGPLRKDILLEDGSELRMNVRISSFATKILTPAIAQIESVLQQDPFKNAFDYKLAGLTTIHNYTSNELTEQFLSSFSSSMALIMIFFMVMLKSVKMAVAANLPDIVPLFCLGWIMYKFGIAMDSDLIVAACIILALSIDDTVHFMLSCRQHLKKNRGDALGAIQNAFSEVGSTIIITQVIFLISLPVLCILPVKVMYQTSILLIIGMSIALLDDLILVPCMMLAIEDLRWSSLTAKVRKFGRRGRAQEKRHTSALEV